MSKDTSIFFFKSKSRSETSLYYLNLIWKLSLIIRVGEYLGEQERFCLIIWFLLKLPKLGKCKEVWECPKLDIIVCFKAMKTIRRDQEHDGT